MSYLPNHMDIGGRVENEYRRQLRVGKESSGGNSPLTPLRPVEESSPSSWHL